MLSHARQPGQMCTKPQDIYVPSGGLRLLVVDKENGGKADSLNAGVNFSGYPLVCAIDADSMLEAVTLAGSLAKPGDAVARMMSLYPATGNVVSASAGRVSVSRDSLESAIRAFWQYVGQNMREPKWEWTTMRVDVLSQSSAVMTTTYRVPHLTPAGQPHV